MRAPIACAWAWPERVAWDAPGLDLAAVGSLTFEAPDEDQFPALALARHALVTGGGAPAAMNAANEIAVEGFLGGGIGFLDIVHTVEETLTRMNGSGDLMACGHDDTVRWAQLVDASARQVAAQVLSRFSGMDQVREEPSLR